MLSKKHRFDLGTGVWCLTGYGRGCGDWCSTASLTEFVSSLKYLFHFDKSFLINLPQFALDFSIVTDL